MIIHGRLDWGKCLTHNCNPTKHHIELNGREGENVLYKCLVVINKFYFSYTQARKCASMVITALA